MSEDRGEDRSVVNLSELSFPQLDQLRNQVQQVMNCKKNAWKRRELPYAFHMCDTNPQNRGFRYFIRA